MFLQPLVKEQRRSAGLNNRDQLAFNVIRGTNDYVDYMDYMDYIDYIDYIANVTAF